ncbi:MAG: hypothetical protein ABNG98_10180 [Flavobacterium sp.]|jgi:hypothetical protein
MEKNDILNKIQLANMELQLEKNYDKRAKIQQRLEVLKIKLEIQKLKDRLSQKLKK